MKVMTRVIITSPKYFFINEFHSKDDAYWFLAVVYN